MREQITNAGGLDSVRSALDLFEDDSGVQSACGSANDVISGGRLSMLSVAALASLATAVVGLLLLWGWHMCARHRRCTVTPLAEALMGEKDEKATVPVAIACEEDVEQGLSLQRVPESQPPPHNNPRHFNPTALATDGGGDGGGGGLQPVPAYFDDEPPQMCLRFLCPSCSILSYEGCSSNRLVAFLLSTFGWLPASLYATLMWVPRRPMRTATTGELTGAAVRSV